MASGIFDFTETLIPFSVKETVDVVAAAERDDK